MTSYGELQLHGAASEAARTEAATLFAAVAKDESVNSATRLDCIAAQLALRAAIRPVPPSARHLSADTLISRALHILAGLPTEQFADARVRTAARHGRRALREES